MKSPCAARRRYVLQMAFALSDASERLWEKNTKQQRLVRDRAALDLNDAVNLLKSQGCKRLPR